MSHNTQDSRFKGLTDQEVLQNRQKYGMNLLTPPKRPSIWKLYLEKFQDPVSAARCGSFFSVDFNH